LVNPASDIYSLGATLYHLLTNRPPFAAGDDILERVQRGDFPPPREVPWSLIVPPELDSICLKAMALRPRDRYSAADKLADEIESWLAGKPVRAVSDDRANRFLPTSRKDTTSRFRVPGVLMERGARLTPVRGVCTSGIPLSKEVVVIGRAGT